MKLNHFIPFCHLHWSRREGQLTSVDLEQSFALTQSRENLLYTDFDKSESPSLKNRAK